MSSIGSGYHERCIVCKKAIKGVRYFMCKTCRTAQAAVAAVAAPPANTTPIGYAYGRGSRFE